MKIETFLATICSLPIEYYEHIMLKSIQILQLRILYFVNFKGELAFEAILNQCSENTIVNGEIGNHWLDNAYCTPGGDLYGGTSGKRPTSKCQKYVFKVIRPGRKNTAFSKLL